MPTPQPSSLCRVLACLRCVGILAIVVLGACGDDGGPAQVDGAVEPSYSVGGTVTGLSGELDLVLNGTELVTLGADGDFAFTTELQDGESYLVTTLGQPAGQECAIVSGSGVIAGADISDVVVTCTAAASGFLVGGAVTGLSAALNLVLNGTELVTVSADGDFAFATELQDGESYLVTMLGQPAGQECAIVSGSGVIAGADVSDVVVTCTLVSAELTSLEFLAVDATFTPAFEPGQFSYEASVSLVVSEVSLVPTAVDPSATILVNGTTVASGAATVPITLDLGSNTVSVQVIASNGASRTYVVVIARGSQSIEQISYLKASNTEDDDRFGTSVALSGDTLVVGAVGEDSNASGANGDQTDNSVDFGGAVYVFRRTGTTWAQEAYIKASNPRPGDFFGFSVALSGDTLAVGSAGEDSNATGMNGNQTHNSAGRSGAVYVFQRTGTTWAQEAYIKASNTDAEDQFGSSITLFGDTLAVGARHEDSNATGVDGNQADNSATGSGAVYVFQRTGTNWTQQAYLKASRTDFDLAFGTSVAMSGDTLAVGAIGEASNAIGVNGDQANSAAATSGAVYIFRRTGTTWAQEAYIKASNTGFGDAFGSSVALSEDTLAVGANRESSSATGVNGNQADNSAHTSGAVYVFQRTGTTWAQEVYLKASNTDIGDAFGSQVALSEDTLAVGAEFEDSNAIGINGDQADNSVLGSGAVYLFRRLGGVWSQEAYLKASDGDFFDSFGTSVALSGDTLAVGAVGEDSNATGVNGNQTDNSVEDSGAVYVFQ